jgi:hypothetical protein
VGSAREEFIFGLGVEVGIRVGSGVSERFIATTADKLAMGPFKSSGVISLVGASGIHPEGRINKKKNKKKSKDVP